MNFNYIDQGRLKVSVLTGDGSLPVPEALVRIIDPSDGTVAEETRTDSSGQTAEVLLPAPPLEYSVSEQTRQPYASYDVTAAAAGMETLHIGGVQVLPNSRAIQKMSLEPAVPGGFNVRNLLITPHTLWGDYPEKIEEEAVKPLPAAEGFVVLPEPVIPEYIIVHLSGPEDSSADNVWIPFKDYIKNVASCEIYSTWKTETIKANVLSIISFTLNRVYTEWYRGRGKDFTITNSTAYDQAFIHGRNIFEEISVVVDDLFSTYITREGISQPLFTQYCDGRRTQCAGLSQWGSQVLGEQGMDAVSILRNYYGSDIYLESAEKVEGVPVSYGGTVLQLGSAGNDVAVIQTQLNRISDNFPAIPKLRVSSTFDETTQEAVILFQQIFDLPQTGVVDFATWYEISNIFVGISKMS